MSRFFLVGIGPGSIDYILPAAMKRVESADVLIGGKRNLETFKDIFSGKTIELKSNYPEVTEYIKENRDKKRIVLVVSGDPGFYSLLNTMLKSFDRKDIVVEPGISSLQYLMAKGTVTLQDGRMISLHGRSSGELEKIVEIHKVVGILTDKINSPTEIAERLSTAGYGDRDVLIGERLSYEDEKISSMKIDEAKSGDFDPLSVMVVYSE